ncbi:protein ABHD14A isoform X3 [Fukomys damarensis]|uniref:protein ABHD14A isoform X3 n=1 Tax=Fukomys damarensis TaxID=885580 RepID=UPI000540234A|nr:protein ABHD14A isoform X3 [Fukomys damarensis]
MADKELPSSPPLCEPCSSLAPHISSGLSISSITDTLCEIPNNSWRGPAVVQTSMSRYHQAALLGLGLLFMLLLYVGLPGPPEQTSWLSGDPNVTVLAGLTRGSSPIFYREVLPLHQARRVEVLLLHGKAFNSHTWEQLGTLQLLSRRGYRAVALDLPGTYQQTLAPAAVPRIWEFSTFEGGKHRGRAGRAAAAGTTGPGGEECHTGEPLTQRLLCPALPDSRPPPATWIRAHRTHLHQELHPEAVLGCEDANPNRVWGTGSHPGPRVTAAAPPPAQPFCGKATQRGPCLLPPQATGLPPRPSCLP